MLLSPVIARDISIIGYHSGLDKRRHKSRDECHREIRQYAYQNGNATHSPWAEVHSEKWNRAIEGPICASKSKQTNIVRIFEFLQNVEGSKPILEFEQYFEWWFPGFAWFVEAAYRSQDCTEWLTWRTYRETFAKRSERVLNVSR